MPEPPPAQEAAAGDAPPAVPEPQAEQAAERTPLSAAGHRPVRSRPATRRREPLNLLAFGLWLVLLLVVGGSVAAALLWRDEIIRTWPAAAPLYDVVGLGAEPPGTGLGLEKVAWKAVSQDGVRLLAVEGEVANRSDQARPVPPIYGVLYDKDDRELQRWSFAAAEGRLLPGERVPFRSEMKEPAAGAVRLQITFQPKTPEKP